MTDTLKEQLSAFLDGELPEAETTLLLKRLERDDDLRGSLSRYSLIGAVMRSEGDVPAARHVALRVSEAIAREPVLGALPAGRRWLRPAAGLAVAASVALATVLLLPQWLGGGTALAPSGGEGTMALAAPGVADSLPVVLAASDDLAPTYTTPPAPLESKSMLPAPQLASFLVAHSEYTSPLSRSSVVTAVPRPAKGQAPVAAVDAKVPAEVPAEVPVEAQAEAVAGGGATDPDQAVEAASR